MLLTGCSAAARDGRRRLLPAVHFASVRDRKMGGTAPFQLPLVLVQCDENIETSNVRFVWEKVTAVTGTGHATCTVSPAVSQSVTFGKGAT